MNWLFPVPPIPEGAEVVHLSSTPLGWKARLTLLWQGSSALLTRRGDRLRILLGGNPHFRTLQRWDTNRAGHLLLSLQTWIGR